MARVRDNGREWAAGIGSRSAMSQGVVEGLRQGKKGRGQGACPEGLGAIADPPARGVSRSADGGAACGGDGLPEKDHFEFISAPFLVRHGKAFTPPPEKGGEKGLISLRRTARRRERYALLDGVLRRHSSLRRPGREISVFDEQGKQVGIQLGSEQPGRLQLCSLATLGSTSGVRVLDHVAHFTGVLRCGLLWVCPLCSAKIRGHRAEEVNRALTRWLEREGIDAWFVTLTLPHDQGDELSHLLKTISEAFHALLAGKAGMANKQRYGMVGHIRVLEVTCGGSGWHPHLHVVVLFERELSGEDLARISTSWYERFARVVEKRGHRRPSQIYGVTWAPVGDGGGLAEYVSKVQEDGLSVHVGSELTRFDMKRGRNGSQTPFEMIREFGETGEMVKLERWWEWEQGSKGKQMMRWSDGLRALLLPDEKELSDQAVAEAEVGGEDIAFFDRGNWRKLCLLPGLKVGVLEAAEEGGYDAVAALCARYGVVVLRPAEFLVA